MHRLLGNFPSTFGPFRGLEHIQDINWESSRDMNSNDPPSEATIISILSNTVFTPASVD